MSSKWAAAGLFLIVLLAACTGDSSAVETAEPVDRLVILDDEGNVVTIRPDGTDELVVAERPAESSFFFQPTWSPSSDRIAWGQGGFDGFALGLAGLDGEAPGSVEMSNNPFYLFWSPDGRWIGALHNSDAGAIDFEIVDTSDLTSSVVANGAPFYFSWEASSERVVAHVEERRFELIELDGTIDDLGDTSPAYQAPQWTEAGIVHLLDEELVLTQADGEQEAIAVVSGPATFVATEAGDRIAAQILGSGGISAGIAAMPSLPRGGVAVLDVSSGEVTQATSDPALAFFWSPDGQSLLILEPADEAGLIEAVVWDGADSEVVVTYSPHPSFVSDLLPFFTQYAQSVRLWSPDSEAFELRFDKVAAKRHD